MKALGAVALLVAAAAVIVVVANPFGTRGDRVRPLEDATDVADPDAPRAPVSIDEISTAMATEPATPESVPSTTTASKDEGPALRGVVVDSVNGQPIGGASIEATAVRIEADDASSVGRPRRPGQAATTEPATTSPAARSTTGADGRFLVPWDDDRPADLRVAAIGYLDDSRRAAAVNEEMRISLRAGSPIRGRVLRTDGTPIEGATVRAEANPKDTDSKLLHLTSVARSDFNGSFELLGHPGLPSSIGAIHPEYMPASVRAAPEGGPVEIRMLPALRTSFRLRTIDGGALASPTVQWSRTSSNGRGIGMGVLSSVPQRKDPTPGRPIDEPDLYGPVKVPCVPSDGTVQFTVRVVGRLPWKSGELPVPPDGGEMTLEATLDRDPAVGSITVRLHDPQGRDLPYVRGETVVTLRRTDGPAQIGRGVARDGSVVFGGLVAGAYEVAATERHLGAATASLVVDTGRDHAAIVQLAAPSALLVTIDTGSKRRAHFQLLRDGIAVAAFVDPAPSAETDPERNPTHFFAGPDGTLLKGLAAGSYTVHLLSPDLVASDRQVEIPVGGTTEVELRAKPK